MSRAADIFTHSWTAADVVERFGAIPLYRIRSSPSPGTATEEDVLEVHAREGRACELIEGVLVEKTLGTYESYLAVLLSHFLTMHVRNLGHGIVLGADGMLRLAPGLIRIPDVSFISWERLAGRRLGEQAVADCIPDLAVEVISEHNTREEMEEKLREYFKYGVRSVWYVYPDSREVHVYTSADRRTILSEEDWLDGGDVLPGFRLELRELFAKPEPPSSMPSG